MNYLVLSKKKLELKELLKLKKLSEKNLKYMKTLKEYISGFSIGPTSHLAL